MAGWPLPVSTLSAPAGYVAWDCPHFSFRSAPHTEDFFCDLEGPTDKVIPSQPGVLLNEILVKFWFVFEHLASEALNAFQVKTSVSPPLPS